MSFSLSYSSQGNSTFQWVTKPLFLVLSYACFEVSSEVGWDPGLVEGLEVGLVVGFLVVGFLVVGFLVVGLDMSLGLFRAGGAGGGDSTTGSGAGGSEAGGSEAFKKATVRSET